VPPKSCDNGILFPPTSPAHVPFRDNLGWAITWTPSACTASLTATRSGSVLDLNVSVRHGCSPDPLAPHLRDRDVADPHLPGQQPTAVRDAQMLRRGFQRPDHDGRLVGVRFPVRPGQVGQGTHAAFQVPVAPLTLRPVVPERWLPHRPFGQPCG